MSELSKPVLKTLLYADIFSYPLTKEEIHTRLIAKKTTPQALNQALKKLLQKGTIQKTEKYHHFPKRKNTVSSRKKRTKYTQEKLTLAKKLVSKHLRSPSILAIFVTGSLAAQNPKKTDDLDLLIITHNNTLWTTRLFLTPYLDIVGKRRTPSVKSLNNKLCLNLYLTPKSLTLPKNSRNLYTAHELILAKPLLNRHNTHSQLLSQNSWLKNFLPNFPFKNTPPKKYPSPLNPLEPLAYLVQRLYMHRKITNEHISFSSAFFHPQSLAPIIDQKLKSQQKRYNLNLF